MAENFRAKAPEPARQALEPVPHGLPDEDRGIARRPAAFGAVSEGPAEVKMPQIPGGGAKVSTMRRLREGPVLSRTRRHISETSSKHCEQSFKKWRSTYPARGILHEQTARNHSSSVMHKVLSNLRTTNEWTCGFFP